jgi:sulfonate transport system substrate-binding protein
VFAQAAGKDLLYVGAEPSKPLSSAILVKAGSPIRSLADLKGRRVALQKGSSAHCLLVRVVDKAGLQWTDILPRVLSTGQGLSGDNSFYLASRAFTEGQPLQLNALFEELTRADVSVQGSRKQAAQLVSDFSGLSLATVHQFLSRRPPSPVAPLSPANVADQQRVADAFLRLGLIPKPVRVADIVWSPARLARS